MGSEMRFLDYKIILYIYRGYLKKVTGNFLIFPVILNLCQK